MTALRKLACRRMWAAALLVWTGACARPGEPPRLELAQEVVSGVEWYRTADSSLVENAGPVAVHLLRIDPEKTTLASILSNDEVAGAETVESMAARHGAVAAINGGFFNRDNGEPYGLLKVGGRLVSDTALLKGAVVINTPADRPMELLFDQVAAKADLRFTTDGREWVTAIAGVDTTRARGKLMFYTPSYHADTDTAPTGTEWVLRGSPLTVTEIRRESGHTPIPRDGAVLSFGGTDLPEALAQLAPGMPVTITTNWRSRHGVTADQLDAADHIVNGAGLLRRDGVNVSSWSDEGLNDEQMLTVRHPRTLIGRDVRGFIWLAAIDGRQPGYSIGMTFPDLQRLCDLLNLRDALNLDGGGSTTMVVNGRIVNRPSDLAGPREVSDALVVRTRSQ